MFDRFLNKVSPQIQARPEVDDERLPSPSKVAAQILKEYPEPEWLSCFEKSIEVNFKKDKSFSRKNQNFTESHWDPEISREQGLMVFFQAATDPTRRLEFLSEIIKDPENQKRWTWLTRYLKTEEELTLAFSILNEDSFPSNLSLWFSEHMDPSILIKTIQSKFDKKTSDKEISEAVSNALQVDAALKAGVKFSPRICEKWLRSALYENYKPLSEVTEMMAALKNGKVQINPDSEVILNLLTEGSKELGREGFSKYCAKRDYHGDEKKIERARQNFNTRRENLYQLHTLFKPWCDINSVDDCGWSIMHKAALAQDVNMLKDFIEMGANPVLKDREGLTPLGLLRQSIQLRRYFASTQKNTVKIKPADDVTLNPQIEELFARHELANALPESVKGKVPSRHL